MIQVTATEAQQRLPDLLDAVRAGEAVSIIGGDGRAFQLALTAPTPVVDPAWPGYPHPGSARGLIVIHDDFDEPLDELKEYLE
jgi:antitoxin (DNA-binding transcriptional repressor) of toxin-antitoxin stability system